MTHSRSASPLAAAPLAAAAILLVVNAAACHGGGAAIRTCTAAGNPEALCACLEKTAGGDDMSAAFSGDFGKLDKVMRAGAACNASTGALGTALAKTCEQVGWDKLTCDCVHDKVGALDADALVTRASDRRVTSLLQVAQALSVDAAGQCALSGGTLASDVATACGDDAALCTCVKAALDPKKMPAPASLDALMEAVVQARDVCVVQAPDVREGVIKGCVDDDEGGGKKRSARKLTAACTCAADAFLQKMKPGDVAELKRSGWTTDALQVLRAERARCTK